MALCLSEVRLVADWERELAQALADIARRPGRHLDTDQAWSDPRAANPADPLVEIARERAAEGRTTART